MTSATPKPRAGEHTKGPWTMYANSPGDDSLPSVMASNPKGGLFYVAQCNNLDDARRIVACVNYCEGVSTAEIEASPPSTNLQAILRMIDGDLPRFTAGRDALRERERELVEVLGKLLDVTKRANIDVPMSDAPVFFAARDLLSKHGR